MEYNAKESTVEVTCREIHRLREVELKPYLATLSHGVAHENQGVKRDRGQEPEESRAGAKGSEGQRGRAPEETESVRGMWPAGRRVSGGIRPRFLVPWS